MIVVSNPGTHPEMMRVAAGLIAFNQDVRYLSSASWSSDAFTQRLADHRFLASTKVGVNLRRRRLPLPITRSQVKGIARGFELLVQVAMRTSRISTASSIQMRNKAFQKGASQFIRGTDNVRVVVGQYTASAEVFAFCEPSVIKVLNYPIAHHRWLMNAMQQESRRNPSWSPLLQGHDFTEHQLRTLDREIEMADLVLVPSSFTASTFLEYGVPEEKISIVPLGCERPTKTIAPKSNSVDGPLQVLFAGQATQRKGIGYLIEAIQEVEDVQLTIVGSCTSEARLAIEKYSNVSLIPSLPREELYRLMQESDLLALPSLAEGFGLVALEAMANGTACLLSRETFAPDLIRHGENGYILDDVSKLSIASALHEIKKDRIGLRSVGERAAATANVYSWDKYSESVAKRLMDLLSERIDAEI